MSRLFEYETIDDAPNWHRVVAGYAASGELTHQQIADALGVTKNAVSKVLMDDVIKTEVARIQARTYSAKLDLSMGMLQLRDEALSAVRNVLTDPKASHSQKLTAAALVFDREPERLFIKQSKATVENTLNVFDSQTLIQVKKRAKELEDSVGTRVIDIEPVEEEQDGDESPETGCDGDGAETGDDGADRPSDPVEIARQGMG